MDLSGRVLPANQDLAAHRRSQWKRAGLAGSTEYGLQEQFVFAIAKCSSLLCLSRVCLRAEHRVCHVVAEILPHKFAIGIHGLHSTQKEEVLGETFQVYLCMHR